METFARRRNEGDDADELASFSLDGLSLDTSRSNLIELHLFLIILKKITKVEKDQDLLTFVSSSVSEGARNINGCKIGQLICR